MKALSSAYLITSDLESLVLNGNQLLPQKSVVMSVKLELFLNISKIFSSFRVLGGGGEEPIVPLGNNLLRIKYFQISNRRKQYYCT